MPEASFLDLSDRSAEDGTVTVWPAWKVQEAGGATSWFHVRLGFTDGARVELLAVVSGEHVCVEDVRARPPLSLADLTVLAHWIRGPLSERCGDGRGGGSEADGACGTSGLPAAYGALADAADATDAADVADTADAADVAEVADVAEAAETADGDEAAEVADGGDRGDRGDEDESRRCVPVGAVPVGAVPAGAGVAEVGAVGESPGPRRARRTWPRGTEGRRLVAQEYRAAQEGGADPVLAVMRATGRSRRRSLRLIAQARDAGYLTPRHARR
ncbi:DUF6214 family protein [Streptomyces asoensis]|uniref:DUF6214 family protein n=1 Tax=Streptomyces asoensis TaxID=249586 RepID=UPI0033C64376